MFKHLNHFFQLPPNLVDGVALLLMSEDFPSTFFKKWSKNEALTHASSFHVQIQPNLFGETYQFFGGNILGRGGHGFESR